MSEWDANNFVVKKSYKESISRPIILVNFRLTNKCNWYRKLTGKKKHLGSHQYQWNKHLCKTGSQMVNIKGIYTPVDVKSR